MVMEIIDMYSSVSDVSNASFNDRSVAMSFLTENTEELGDQVLNYLIANGQFEEALSFVDQSGQFSKMNRDFLIVGICLRDENAADAWKFILRLESALLAARMIETKLKDWDASTCVDMLYYGCSRLKTELKDRADCDLSVLLKRLETRLEQLLSYNALLSKCVDESGRGHWTHWTDLEAATLKDPSTVVKFALDAHEFELARRWCAAHSLSSREISERYILNHLEDGNYLRALGIINELSKEDFVATCTKLLKELNSLESFHFVVQVLLCSPNTKMNTFKMAALRESDLGCLLLKALPSDLRHRLRPLVGHPRRIVEHLLMTKSTQNLEAVKSALGGQTWDSLIEIPQASFSKDFLGESLRSAVPLPADGKATFHDILFFFADKSLSFLSLSMDQFSKDEEEFDTSFKGDHHHTEHSAIGIESIAADGKSMKSRGKTVDLSEESECVCCKRAFGILRQRHQCRYCGHIVCGSCSSVKLHHADRDKSDRICDSCLFASLPKDGMQGVDEALSEARSTRTGGKAESVSLNASRIAPAQRQTTSKHPSVAELYHRITREFQVAKFLSALALC
jgi:hypothetical protein